MELKSLLEAVYKYGSPMVYSGVFLFILYKLGGRILTSYEKREIQYAEMINVGIKGLTESQHLLSQSIAANTSAIQETTRNMKDGFDRMSKANEFHRSDLERIAKKIDDGHEKAEIAREKIINTITENECQAGNK